MRKILTSLVVVILVILMLISIRSEAQCSKQKDKFTDVEYITSGPQTFFSKDKYSKAAGAITFSRLKDKSIIDFHIYTRGITYCCNEKSVVIILFKDGAKKTLGNSLSFNCDGNIRFTEYGDSTGVFIDFANKAIESIRFVVSDGHQDIDFDKYSPEPIKKAAACMIKQNF